MININKWDLIWYHIILKELKPKIQCGKKRRNILYKCKHCWKEKEKLLNNIKNTKNISCWCLKDMSFMSERIWDKNPMYWREARNKWKKF